MNPYIIEFFSQRLIQFLLFVVFVSGIGTIATDVSLWTLSAILIGMVLLIVFEYIAHRFLMHEFPKLFPAIYEGHAAHHKSPNDTKYLFGPVSYDAIIYPIIFLMIWLVTIFNWHLAFAVVFGLSTYQMYYQWKHYISHRPFKPLTPWGRWVKKKHLLHHHLDENAWYGVSTPILDALFKTNQPSASASENKMPITSKDKYTI